MSEQPLREARRSPPGFRFSVRDAAVIVSLSLATAWLWGRIGSASLLGLAVLAHFFLFCNVFRVRTRYELVWATSLLLNAAAWQLMGELGWQGVLGIQVPITILVIGAELRSPTYCGIGHRWIHSRSGPRGPVGAPQ